VIRVIDPIADPAWADLLARHPAASVFHTPGWLDALRRTYGYQLFAITTSPGPSLDNGLVVCRVKGWRGYRLVSLPFSDHCDPLVDRSEDLQAMLSFLSSQVEDGRCRSIELRPRQALWSPGDGFRSPGPSGPGNQFTLHTLDLRPDLPEIFRRFHPSCVQRAIRRAEREGLVYEAGTSEQLLAAFYGLLRTTRRRHGLPPQPMAWFRNLVECLPSTPSGRSGQGVTIHVASKDGQAVAAMLTLRFGESLVYKYGGSDSRQHRLGGVPFLFWQVIQRVKDLGVLAFDLGRSDVGQTGLVRFKDHLGAERSAMTYYRLPAGRDEPLHTGWAARAARRTFPYLPDPALDLAGRLLYRHLG
jgi:CelD/BcsL family acetyltransferase involved in cellulose biosynthesis